MFNVHISHDTTGARDINGIPVDDIDVDSWLRNEMYNKHAATMHNTPPVEAAYNRRHCR
ncbi:MAG: hypothetical protein JXA08_07240 [Methanomicrobiaceae archaeon]|nr:hypothetical protein [Methanomicrobiaceae archaeon]